MAQDPYTATLVNQFSQGAAIGARTVDSVMQRAQQESQFSRELGRAQQQDEIGNLLAGLKEQRAQAKAARDARKFKKDLRLTDEKIRERGAKADIAEMDRDFKPEEQQAFLEKRTQRAEKHASDMQSARIGRSLGQAKVDALRQAAQDKQTARAKLQELRSDSQATKLRVSPAEVRERPRTIVEAVDAYTQLRRQAGEPLDPQEKKELRGDARDYTELLAQEDLIRGLNEKIKGKTGLTWDGIITGLGELPVVGKLIQAADSDQERINLLIQNMNATLLVAQRAGLKSEPNAQKLQNMLQRAQNVEWWRDPSNVEELIDVFVATQRAAKASTAANLRAKNVLSEPLKIPGFKPLEEK